MRIAKVSFLFGVLICLHIGECVRNTFSEAEERPAIIQFFRYIDETSKYAAENITDLLLGFLRTLYNSAPEKNRSSTTAIIKDYINDLEFAKSTGNTARMQEAAADFDKVMEKIIENLKKEEQEDVFIKQNMHQVLTLLQRLAVVCENFLHKLNRAADALSAKFTDEGFGRHEKLFALFTDLKNTSITDSQRPHELLGMFNDLKRDYLS